MHASIVALLLTAVTLPAFASDVVVSADPRGASWAGSSGAAIVHPAELLARDPVGMNGSRFEGCDGPPLDLQLSVSRVESRLVYLEHESAMAEADVAVDGLACLDKPVSASQISRLLFLAGLAHARSGSSSLARSRWSQARKIDPDIGWDDDLGDGGRDAFDQTVAAASAPLRRFQVHGPAAEAIWIDGNLVGEQTVAVRGQDHLLQVRVDGEVTSWKMGVVIGETSIAIPVAYPEDVLAWSGDPAERPALDHLLVATYGAQDRLWVVLDRRVWRWTDGAWDRQPGKPFKPGLIGGGAVALTGAALAIGATRVHERALNDQRRAVDVALDQNGDGVKFAGAREVYNAADGRRRRAGAVYYSGLGLAGVGVVAATASVLLPRIAPGVRIVPRAGRDSAGLQISVER